MARKQRIQTAKLDQQRVGIGSLMGLTISELMFVGVFGLFFLFSLGVNLPLLPKIVASAIWPLLAILLFFVKRDGDPVVSWLGVLLPFWLRQRRFRFSSDVPARLRAGGAIDRATGTGLNAISFRWESGDDGVRELHVFEDPRRPYRAAAMRTARANKQLELAARARVALPPSNERIALNQRWLGSDAQVHS